jgi:protein-tyrosine phosphatase
MGTEVVNVQRDADVAPAATKAAAALRRGKLVGFPTETVYGIAAVAGDAGAMQRLRELKSRPKRPFSVHLAHPEHAARYVREMPDFARRLAAKAWPGPVTLLVPTGGRLADPALEKAGLHQTLCHGGTIGLRCPDHAVSRAMLAAVDGPVVAPSANLASGPPPRSAEDVLAVLDGKIDLLIDAGPTRCGGESTIVAVSEDDFSIVRAGVCSKRAIRGFLTRSILIVCTGNTCRSPMAVGIARKLLAERYGCSVRELRTRKLIEVSSAGVLAAAGARASAEAVRAARLHGANIARHRSRKLTTELIRSADLVLCMTSFHLAQIRRLAPWASEKVMKLDETGDVSDPIGGGIDVYRQTGRRIERALRARLGEGAI